MEQFSPREQDDYCQRHYSADFDYHICINNSNTRYHSSSKANSLGARALSLPETLAVGKPLTLKSCSYMIIIILLMNRTLNKDEPITESALMLVCNRGLFTKIRSSVALQSYHIMQNNALHLQCLP